MSYFRGTSGYADRQQEKARQQALAHQRLMDEPRWRKMNREDFINTLTQKHNYDFNRAVSCWNSEIKSRIAINAEHMYDLLKKVRENIPGVPELIIEIEGTTTRQIEPEMATCPECSGICGYETYHGDDNCETEWHTCTRCGGQGTVPKSTLGVEE